LPFCAAAQHLQKVNMNLIVNFDNQSIHMNVTQHWVNTENTDTLKLNLQAPYRIKMILLGNQAAPWQYDTLSHTLSIALFKKSPTQKVKIICEGKPRIAVKPPWDGGFIWTKSANGKDWLTVACQGEGASLWWPVPQRYDDKPDTVEITAEYPEDLFFKGNGRLIKDIVPEHRRITTWLTTYPIHTYNVTLNIGDYEHRSDTLTIDQKTKLSLDFYPLRDNLQVSRQQFAQSREMLTCFNAMFGEYPYLNDGYSVVETPYAGMEHQSAIAYGNGYKNGYRAEDYSGMNLPFDFILIHESAHEWWGNSVSAKTADDFWLQEAFCTYAEMIYVQCRFGEANALRYINLKKRLVKNEAPILGPGDSGADMYSKGALMIHTMSQFADTKELWLETLKLFYQEHKYQSIDTKELISWFCDRLNGLKPEFFQNYLQNRFPPKLNFSVLNTGDSSQFKMHLSEVSGNFVMPVILSNSKGETKKVFVGSSPFSIKLEGSGWSVNENYSYFILNQLEK
ncbi:MAG: hypothetical protein KDC13_09060, partial [Bacteroidetes bacterium]|nr:hypothetical protein [Bacteroidota bacterium]